MSRFEINIDISRNVENAIDECLLYHHVDMYFLYIYREIINIESEKYSASTTIDLHKIYSHYVQVCSFVLKHIGNVETDPYWELNTSEINFLEVSYKKLIDYGISYKNVIPLFILYRKYIKKVLDEEIKDTPPMYSHFYQLCLLQGFKIALDRIQDNLNNSSYFAHDFITTLNQTVIKIYLTPNGLTQKAELIKIAKSGKIEKLVDDYLSENDILKFTNELRQKELKTRFTYLEKKSNEVFFYQRRNSRDDEYVEFGEQDRQDPYKALIIQGQMNLTKELF